jgi:hypothetical protein
MLEPNDRFAAVVLLRQKAATVSAEEQSQTSLRLHQAGMSALQS